MGAAAQKVNQNLPNLGFIKIRKANNDGLSSNNPYIFLLGLNCFFK